MKSRVAVEEDFKSTTTMQGEMPGSPAIPVSSSMALCSLSSTLTAGPPWAATIRVNRREEWKSSSTSTMAG